MNPYEEQRILWERQRLANERIRKANERLRRMFESQGLYREPTVNWPKPRPAWCDVLGVEPDATRAAITATYRLKAKETHPDRGGSAQAFQRVQDAYRSAIRHSSGSR